MTERPSESAPADAALAREIEQALAVDPSREFVARVRERVLSQPASSPWVIQWVMAGAGAAAAVMTISVWTLRAPTPHSDTRPDIALASTHPVVIPHDALTPAIVAPTWPPAARESRAREARAVARATGTDPEVLIAPGEAAALKRLLSGATRPLDLPTLSSLTRPTDIAALSPLKDIVLASMADIASITIEPLGAGTREEGVRQ